MLTNSVSSGPAIRCSLCVQVLLRCSMYSSPRQLRHEVRPPRTLARCHGSGEGAASCAPYSHQLDGDTRNLRREQQRGLSPSRRGASTNDTWSSREPQQQVFNSVAPLHAPVRALTSRRTCIPCQSACAHFRSRVRSQAYSSRRRRRVVRTNLRRQRR